MFAPTFEAASEQHPDITFAKIDTEAEPQLAGQAQIMSIPTLMAFRDGILLWSQPGVIGAQQLNQLIDFIKGIDMDEVRQKAADQAAEN